MSLRRLLLRMRGPLKALLVIGFFTLLICFTISLNSDEKCERSSDGVHCQGDGHSDGIQKYTVQSTSGSVDNVVEEKAAVDSENADEKWWKTMHLSVVACGDRLEETLVMIKSAVLLARAPIHVHIFADDDLRPAFKQQLDSWPAGILKRLSFSIRPIQFPDGQDATRWKSLFKPCASQRLFIPDILREVDALLYVDTDILFMRPFDDIWGFFNEFNSTQLAAVAPEHEEPTASWYSRFARHPYVPPYGVNSGVMLMNLTRMRKVNWIRQMVDYYQKYRYDITWGDQDLINIFFHYFPEKLFQYPCKWNYRPDHCMYMSNCKSAEQDGVSVLHGCRSVFHNEKQPTFKAVYEAIREHKFDDDLEQMQSQMRTNLKSVPAGPCSRVARIFTKELDKQLQQRQ